MDGELLTRDQQIGVDDGGLDDRPPVELPRRRDEALVVEERADASRGYQRAAASNRRFAAA